MNAAQNAAYLKIFQTLQVTKMVDEANSHTTKPALLGLNDINNEKEWIGTYTGKS